MPSRYVFALVLCAGALLATPVDAGGLCGTMNTTLCAMRLPCRNTTSCSDERLATISCDCDSASSDTDLVQCWCTDVDGLSAGGIAVVVISSIVFVGCCCLAASYACCPDFHHPRTPITMQSPQSSSTVALMFCCLVALAVPVSAGIGCGTVNYTLCKMDLPCRNTTSCASSFLQTFRCDCQEDDNIDLLSTCVCFPAGAAVSGTVTIVIAVIVFIVVAICCGCYRDRLCPPKTHTTPITVPSRQSSSTVALMFCCLVALAIPVSAGNQTLCNNTALVPSIGASSSRFEYGGIAFQSYLCQSSWNCTICLSDSDQVITAQTRQAVLDVWGAFLDENECWGLRVREIPGADPWATMPSKIDFVRDYTKSACNVSSVKCAFAYQDDYCPTCPTCPTCAPTNSTCTACPSCPTCPTCQPTNSTCSPCEVTPADIASEKQAADKREKELMDYSILIGVLCAVATLCIGYGLGRWHESVSHRSKSPTVYLPQQAQAPVSFPMQPLYVVPGSSSSSHVNQSS